MPDVEIALSRRGLPIAAALVIAFALNACAPPTMPVRESEPTLQEEELAMAVFSETNSLRSSPKAYAEAMKQRRNGYEGETYYPHDSKVGIVTKEGVAALNEAIAELSAQPPLQPLRWSETLAELARAHVQDTGPKGLVGHSASNGDSFEERVAEVMQASHINASGENIAYGLSSGQEVVVHLFVDDGVAGRGHRKNILSREFNSSGVACGQHTRYETMCVVIYGNIK